MAGRDDEATARAERARAIGLFRYQLVREAADPQLSTKARGRLVRAIAAGTPTRQGVGSGFPATPWTVGSGPGVAVGSTRWSPARGSQPRGGRWR